MSTFESTTSSPTKAGIGAFLDNILQPKPVRERNDPFRFQVGVNFKAKIIGIDDVPEPRGDRMCQEVIQREKLQVKASGQHKQQIIINISLEGIRIIDAMSMNAIHQHPVHRISFISRDVSDARAFGYIYGPGDGTHKFFGIKTEKAAEQTVLALRDLFQVVFEMKKKETEDKKKEAAGDDEPKSEAQTLDKKKEEEVMEKAPEVAQNAPAQAPAPEPSLLELVDLNNLKQNIDEINSFDPIDSSQSFGAVPDHKNPPLGDLEDNDPFATSPTSLASMNSSGALGGAGGSNWAAFGSQSSTQAPFSPTSTTSGTDLFASTPAAALNMQTTAPFGGGGPAPGAPFGAPGGGFGAPMSPPMSGGPFGATSPFGAPQSAGGFGGAPQSAAGFGGAPQSAAGFGGAPQSAAGFGGAPQSAAGGFGGAAFGAPPPMGNPMGGGMAPNGPSANPFLSAGGGMFGGPGGGGMAAPDPMSNGFGAPLAPAPAPGTEVQSTKKSVDPMFGDLVSSFGTELGQKKKDEFFKAGPGPKMNELQPQVSGDDMMNAFDTDPFNTASANARPMNAISSTETDSETNSPDQDIPAPSIPPPPLPSSTLASSSTVATPAQDLHAPSLPPRPSGTARQTSTSSASSVSSLTHNNNKPFFTLPSVSGKAIQFNFPTDAPPAPPPRPGSRPSTAMKAQSSFDSASDSPKLPRQTSVTANQIPPALPARRQQSMALPPDGSTPPPLPTTSPPKLANSTPPLPQQSGDTDTPPPPPPRPSLGSSSTSSQRAPKLGSMSRAMTVPEHVLETQQQQAVPRPRPRAHTPTDNKTAELSLAEGTAPKQMQADPFAVTLPKSKSRNVDSTFARPRPRPRSKTPTAFTSAGFSVQNDFHSGQNMDHIEESKNSNTPLQNASFNFESQHLDSNKTVESPGASFRLSNNHAFGSDQRTATPLSVHSVSSDHVVDPFENVDPFEKDGGDPFAANDPFQDEDPFAGVDPFGNDSNDSEFQTKAVSAEGVPLRPDSCNNERRKKLQVHTEDMFSSDPFSSNVDSFHGKKLDAPLIGDGHTLVRNSLVDPFDTAFAAATLNTTSITPQFNHCDTNTVQNHVGDSFNHHFSAGLNISDSAGISFDKYDKLNRVAADTQTVNDPSFSTNFGSYHSKNSDVTDAAVDMQIGSDPPFSTSIGSYHSQSSDVTDAAPHSADGVVVQQESDSTSYNSEVSEAFATTPRSHNAPHQGSTPGIGNTSNGRGTPGNPFLPTVPIPPQAPQPPPPGATLLDF